jgi:hypothetical protein
VLLSLVRTRVVGHLRDVRRLVVALSRARLGLYVFGRRSLFANCFELQPAFSRLLARPTQVRVVGWVLLGWKGMRRLVYGCAAQTCCSGLASSVHIWGLKTRCSRGQCMNCACVELLWATTCLLPTSRLSSCSSHLLCIRCCCSLRWLRVRATAPAAGLSTSRCPSS